VCPWHNAVCCVEFETKPLLPCTLFTRGLPRAIDNAIALHAPPPAKIRVKGFTKVEAKRLPSDDGSEAAKMLSNLSLSESGSPKTGVASSTGKIYISLIVRDGDSGLTLELCSGHVMVADVAPHSPAAAAGVIAGDKVKVVTGFSSPDLKEQGVFKHGNCREDTFVALIDFLINSPRPLKMSIRHLNSR
jgi:hypothetical protein